jgi:hypothetical protein
MKTHLLLALGVHRRWNRFFGLESREVGAVEVRCCLLHSLGREKAVAKLAAIVRAEVGELTRQCIRDF